MKLKSIVFTWHGLSAIFVSSSSFCNFGCWILIAEVHSEMESHLIRTDLNIMKSLRTWPQFVSAKQIHAGSHVKSPGANFFFFFSLMDTYFVRLALQWSYKYISEILITCLNSSTACARSDTT